MNTTWTDTTHHNKIYMQSQKQHVYQLFNEGPNFVILQQALSSSIAPWSLSSYYRRKSHPYKPCLQNHEEALIRSKLQVQAHGVSFFFHLHFYSPAFTPLSERYTQNHKQALIKSKLQVQAWVVFLFVCFLSIFIALPLSLYLRYIHIYAMTIALLREAYFKN